MDLARFESLVAYRTRLRTRDTLYRIGDAFHVLYAIRRGTFKTVVLAEDGREQVTGFHVLGEIVGFDGIGNDRHDSSAIALEDSEVCVLPFAGVETLARTLPPLQHHLHQLMAREIAQDQRAIFALGTLQAEQRIAAFLLNLAARYGRRGYSSTDFILRMTRSEMGSLLGVTLETVSRILSRFHHRALIRLDGRRVQLVEPARLARIAREDGRVAESRLRAGRDRVVDHLGRDEDRG